MCRWTDSAAEFVGSINLYPAHVVGDGTGNYVVEIAGLGRVSLPAPPVASGVRTAGGSVVAAFRPQAVRLAGAGPAEGLAFEAEVGATEFLGEFVRHELTVGGLRIVADLPHARFGQAQASGARVRFVVPAGEVLVLSA